VATIHFAKGLIDVPQSKQGLSKGVGDPGNNYMETASKVLENIRTYLSEYGELPNVEDVAHQLLIELHGDLKCQEKMNVGGGAYICEMPRGHDGAHRGTPNGGNVE
jgi:hypothetical protein